MFHFIESIYQPILNRQTRWKIKYVYLPRFYLQIFRSINDTQFSNIFSFSFFLLFALMTYTYRQVK